MWDVRGGRLLAQVRSPGFWWPYGALASVLVAAMWPVWVATDRLTLGSDMVISYYPWHVLWRAVVAGRESVFWNPYAFGGTPALPAAHSGFAYPGHWLLTPLPPILAVNWANGLHVLLAGLGAAWCARGIGASRDGMFLAGVAYGLGSVMVARQFAGHIGFVEANAWLPVAVGAAVRIGRPGMVSLLAASVGMMVLTGQPEPWLFAAWMLPVCVVGLAWGRGWPALMRALVRLGAGFALGIGLAGFFLLPFLAYLEVSNRSFGMDWEFRAGGSLPPWHLLTLLSPRAFGDGTGAYWPGPGYEWHERLLYLGIVPLVAALWAPERRRLLWLALAVVGMLLAFGRYAPAFAALEWLPGYGSMRVPPKHLIVVGLALALAAGLGVERLRGWRAALALAALGGVCFMLATDAVFLTGRLIGWSGEAARFHLRDVGRALQVAEPSMMVAAAICAVSAVAVLLPGRVGRLLVLTVAVLDVWLILLPHRVASEDPMVLSRVLEPIVSLERAAVVGNHVSIYGNYGPVVGLRLPAGYQSLFGGRFMELVTGAGNAGVVVEPRSVDDPILRRLGYRHVVDLNRNQVVVLEPPPALVWVARCTWPGGAREVRAPDFPLSICVARESATVRDEPVPPGPASIEDEGPARLTVSAEGPGWLATTIPWYPGWQAEVDGLPTPVEIVDGALVGVPLAGGVHTVTLRYVPAGWEAGVSLTVAALLLAGAAWVADRCWRRLPPRSTILWHPGGGVSDHPPAPERGS